MILDKENLFSEDQAITVTAVSTNVIDLGADNARNQLDNEKNAEVLCQVTTAFSGGTSVKASLYADDDEAFGSAVLVQESAVIAAASLVAGYQFKLGKGLPRLGAADKRYLRMTYTVVGTFSAGKVMAGLIFDKQTANS